MARQQQEREEVAAAAERLAWLVMVSVEATLEQRSPEPGRLCVEMLMEGREGEEARATELMVTLILVRWLSVARDELPPVAEGAADHVEVVLDWVGEALGPRYRSRARYTSGPLVGEDSAAGIMQYRNALRGDFLPSLVWLLAGVVAVYGDGDAGWLRRLVGVSSPAT